MVIAAAALWEALRRPDPLGFEVRAWPPSREDGSEEEARRAVERLGFGAGVLREAAYLAVDAREAARRRVEREGGMLLPLGEALRELPEARRRAWSLVDPRTDPHAAAVALAEAEEAAEGYVLYLPRGVRLATPIYACMLVTRREGRQLLHNLVILEPGAEAVLVTGCASAPSAIGAVHAGVTEIVLGEGARLSYAMVHSWGRGSHVRPRTAALLRRGASLVSYYVVHGPVGSLHSEPRTVLGNGASAHLASIAVLDAGVARIGSRTVLAEPGASAEIESRIVVKGSARVEAPLRLTARAPARGHVECMGLALSPDAFISSAPILESTTSEAELSHEAAIGRLRGDEIEYLAARGLDEATARRLLLQGVLHVEAPLPPAVKALARSVEKLLAERAAA